MEKEEIQLKKRLWELADKAAERNCVTYTNFLNLNEINILFSLIPALSNVTCRLYGGYDNAERQIAAFIPDALYYDWNYPLAVLKVGILSKKTTEQLSHRDYLGAILSLGVERSKIGDIIVDGQEAYFFCLDNLQDFFLQELTVIKHTAVAVSLAADGYIYKPNFREVTGSIASNRLDNSVSLAFHISRSRVSELINNKKVFVNSRSVTSSSLLLKAGDVVSVRGMGKFIYDGIISQTKKGRFFVRLQKYE